jgi:Zn-dependent protease with chaperone function
MLSFAARFYDGLSPQALDVHAVLDGPMLRLDDAGGSEIARWASLDLFLPPQDKSLPEAYIASRAVPHARLLVGDRAALLALAGEVPALAWLRQRGSHGGRRAVAVLATVATAAVLLVGAMLWRGPEILAPFLPQSWQVRLGDQIVAAVTRGDRRCTNPQGMAALDDLVGRLHAASGHGGPIEVQVVDSEVINAFAVPGGRIVVFRGLLDNAETPDEVAAVLAHEMGHVVHGHPTRALLRQLGLTALQRLAFGSYGDSFDTVASMGQTMLALRNGRDAEREADATAIAMLERAGLKADGLNAFFALMERKSGGADFGWLSTHPPLDERRQATQHDDTGKPALDRAQWKHLQAICDGGSRSAPLDRTRDGKSTPAPPPPPPPKGRGTNGRDRI